MTEAVRVEGSVLADLVAEFFRGIGVLEAENWDVQLDAMRQMTFSLNMAEKSYWVELYKSRKATAAGHNKELAETLDVVVRALTSFEGDYIALVLFNFEGFGHFIWLDPGLSSVVACFRAKDKRG